MRETSEGLRGVAAERQRQIGVKGFTPEHDAEHTLDELLKAAFCYLADVLEPRSEEWLELRWPWHRDWWKPTPDDRVRQLTKAAALIVAEMDRIQANERKQNG